MCPAFDPETFYPRQKNESATKVLVKGLIQQLGGCADRDKMYDVMEARGVNGVFKVDTGKTIGVEYILIAQKSLVGAEGINTLCLSGVSKDSLKTDPKNQLVAYGYTQPVIEIIEEKERETEEVAFMVPSTMVWDLLWYDQPEGGDNFKHREVWSFLEEFYTKSLKQVNETNP